MIWVDWFALYMRGRFRWLVWFPYIYAMAVCLSCWGFEVIFNQSKIVLDGAGDMCILVTMRPTKNTNRATRAWVDGILCQLDLVIADGSYRDILETLKAHQIANSSPSEVTESLTVYLCMTKSEAQFKRNLAGSCINKTTIENL
jgi:hypothetical protein